MFRCVVDHECTTAEGRPIFVLISEQFGAGYVVIYCLISFIMNFGLFNVIAALYVENIVAAAKFNSLHQKRQRLLDSEMFARKTKTLVEFIWHAWSNAIIFAPGDQKPRVS